MKRKHIDTAALASNVPPASPAFRAATMARLQAMADQEAFPVKRKLSTTILIAALILVLLTATAFALGLFRTAEADAMYRARQSLSETYGLTPATLGMFRQQAIRQGNIWTVTFSADDTESSNGKMGVYTVTMEDGSAPIATWTHDDVDADVWKSGDMDAPVWGQEQMMQSLILKRDALNTYVEEHAGVVPDNQELQPMTDLSAEQQAAIVDIAKQAMIDEFGFTEKMLMLFTVDIVPSEEHGEAYGVAVFGPDYAQDPANLQMQLGYYYITVEVETGKMLKSMWIWENHWIGKSYTKNNWGTASAYHVSILPWVLELYEKINEIGSRYAPGATVYDYSYEDAVAYDQLFRDAGFSAAMYPRALPGSQDISYDKALAIAKQALMEEMSLTEEKLNAANLMAEYSIADPDEPIWSFGFYTNADGFDVVYAVTLDVRTGEILGTFCNTGGNG